MNKFEISKKKYKLKRLLEKYNFGNLGDYPAFFKFLTKKSFSLVSKSNFDFLSFSLISVVGFFLILLVFINLKINLKKMTLMILLIIKTKCGYIFLKRENILFCT